MYGPTENTTFSTCYPITGPHETSVPIGKPIRHSTAYIVDAYGELLPVGVPGELCVGGDGVARGYLNQPELTAQKFVDNPFEPGTKMYRTGEGDLARWLPDGHIEFMGRMDSQIKLRGFRIKLGEIEAKLAEHPHAKEVVVTVREERPGDKALRAYFVTDRDIPASEWRAYLAKALPEYMIPAAFVQIDRMPLKETGKIDKKALPEPNGSIPSPGESCNQGGRHLSPRDPWSHPASSASATRIEAQLIGIVQNLLHTEGIGPGDNFFQCGGNSLALIRLVVEMEAAFGVVPSIMEIREAPVISEWAKKVESLQKQAAL
ncbi:non-ribosomal peptide synthetase [Paenibacillus elgii]